MSWRLTAFAMHFVNGLSIVAHAPSNVKDAAVGKSFIFIAIVMRNAMGTLMRAASAIVPTLGCEIHATYWLSEASSIKVL